MSDQKKDLMDIAVQAEQDLNSDRLKGGAGQGFGKKDTHGGSTSTDESGIDQGADKKFSEFGASSNYGSSVSGAGNNRDIPPEEGGDIQKGTGRMTKASDFDQGAPGEGPEDVAKRQAEAYGGDDSVRSNITNQAGGEGTGGMNK